MLQKRENNHDKTLLARWCDKKAKIYAGRRNLRNKFVKAGEVWWATLGYNIGVEVNGKKDNFSRPVIVLRVYSKEMVLILPLTSKDKSNSEHFYKLGEIGGKTAFVSLSQS